MLLSLGRLLDVRKGEGRIALVLFGHLFFVTAAAIVLSASKNGLFLDAYPAALIPHVIVAAALVTAVFAILFTGLTGGFPRRMVVEATTGVAAVSLILSRFAFLADPRWAFVLYLWLSIVGALVIALAWGSVGDLLTGRQSRRLMPLLIAGTSVAGMTAGFGLAPAAETFGTPDLLFGAALALVLGAAVLRLAPAPAAPAGDDAGTGFLGRVRKGALLIRHHRLLALLAGAVVLSAIIATLVDYQFKAVLQQAYDRDAITSLFGVLAGAVGFGTLLFQALASRILFRRWGLVSGGYVQAALIGLSAIMVAATGWLVALAALRFVDEAGRFTLQKSVEQVSVAPYPPATRRAALTVLGGVLKPLATALTGVALMLAAPLLGVRGLAVLTALAAGGLFALFRRHPRLYRRALEEALARHTFQLDDAGEGALKVLDREALEVLDRALESDDPGLLIFAVSLLRRAPRSEALPRLGALLDAHVPEVRAEAAAAVVELVEGTNAPLLDRVRTMLADDPSPDVILSLLDVAPGMGPPAAPLVAAHLDHDDDSVRRRALVALARAERRYGGDRATRRVERLLRSDEPADRVAGLGAVSVLGFERLAEPAFEAARDPATRSAAASALANLGEAGSEWLLRLVRDPGLDDGDLAAIATQLAEAGHDDGLAALLDVVADRGTTEVALTPLRRARRSGRLPAVPRGVMRRVLEPILLGGARYAVLTDAFRRERGRHPYLEALHDELRDRHARAGEGVLAGLSLSYDTASLDRVAPHLRAPDASIRSSAMELLEGILDPEDRLEVLPFFEGFASPDRLAQAFDGLSFTPGHARRDPLGALARVPDAWLRDCAVFVRSHLDGTDTPGTAAATAAATASPEESTMLPLMEIVFFLKSSSLFRPLPGEELARVASLADTVHLDADEVLFEQGDPGDAFYMVVTGRVAVEVGTRQVATFGPHEGIGEMALLDGEPRSATVRATEPATLLRIEAASFEALVDRTPALAKSIYRTLSARLRTANRQLQD
ncbi:MAG: cyclic nucleotide-binding domain-containing protein [Longimicrobiales bacterium]